MANVIEMEFVQGTIERDPDGSMWFIEDVPVNTDQDDEE